MPPPTLGFQEDTTLSKTQIALIQLNEAVALFVQEKFLPALTLAGAAEVILGQLLVRKGELPSIKETTQSIERLRQSTGLEVMRGKTEREMIDDWNRPRNNAKHLIGPEGEAFTANLCDEAYWMIRRAVENASKLQLSVEREQDFVNWVVINVAA